MFRDRLLLVPSWIFFFKSEISRDREISCEKSEMSCESHWEENVSLVDGNKWRPSRTLNHCIILSLKAGYRRAVLGTTNLSNGKGIFGSTGPTGQGEPPWKLVFNIPVGPDRNGLFHLMYQPKLPEFWVEWKAAQYYASVNSTCAQAPPGWPPGISIFFCLGWQISGGGDSWAGKSPGVGKKKEAKCPVLRQQCNIFYWSHSPIVPF